MAVRTELPRRVGIIGAPIDIPPPFESLDELNFAANALLPPFASLEWQSGIVRQLVPLLASGQNVHCTELRQVSTAQIVALLYPLLAEMLAVPVGKQRGRLVISIRSREVCYFTMLAVKEAYPQLKVSCIVPAFDDSGWKSTAEGGWDVLFISPARLSEVFTRRFRLQRPVTHLVMSGVEEMCRQGLEEYISNFLAHIKVPPRLVLEETIEAEKTYQWLQPYLGPHYLVSSLLEFTPTKLE